MKEINLQFNSKYYREYYCEWFFVGWDCIALGIALGKWHIEIHLPFGFLRWGVYYYPVQNYTQQYKTIK